MSTILMSFALMLAFTGSAQPENKVAMKEFVYKDNNPNKYQWKTVCVVRGRTIFNNSIACTDSVIYSFGGFDTRVVQREINMIKNGKFTRTDIEYPGKGFMNNLFFISDSLLFAGGGVDSNKAVYGEVDFWQYNLNSKIWTRLKDLPFYYRTTPVIFNNKEEIIAMIPQLNGEEMKQTIINFYTYNFQADTWTLLKSTNKIPDYADPVSFKVGSDVYVLFQRGQLHRQPAKEFFKFDLKTRVWSRIGAFPGRERTLAFACSDDRYGYIGGGIWDLSGNNASDVYRYDPAQESWERCRQLPEGLRWGKAWFFNDNIYVGFGIGDKEGRVPVWMLRPKK